MFIVRVCTISFFRLRPHFFDVGQGAVWTVFSPSGPLSPLHRFLRFLRCTALRWTAQNFALLSFSLTKIRPFSSTVVVFSLNFGLERGSHQTCTFGVLLSILREARRPRDQTCSSQLRKTGLPTTASGTKLGHLASLATETDLAFVLLCKTRITSRYAGSRALPQGSPTRGGQQAAGTLKLDLPLKSEFAAFMQLSSDVDATPHSSRKKSYRALDATSEIIVSICSSIRGF